MITKESISDMGDGRRLNGYVVIQSIEERASRSGNGNTYLTGNIQAKGAIPYKVWSNAPCFQELRNQPDVYKGVVCEIQGKVNIYEGQTSIIIETCRIASGNDVPDAMEFFGSKYDANRYFDSLRNTLVKNCSENAVKVFDLVMAKYKHSFINEFAAISHHDNCRSGLIGHTTKGEKMLSLLNMYPAVLERAGGKDVVFIGFALHDIGKVLEYRNGSISAQGMKISHMISGVMALMEFKDAIEDLMGNDFFESLVSVISQHSGEYGERPRTVAAYVAHLIDTLESRLASLEEVADNPGQLMFEGFRLN